jgi:hypothetical protein
MKKVLVPSASDVGITFILRIRWGLSQATNDDPYVRDMVSDELQKIINLIKEVK